MGSVDRHGSRATSVVAGWAETAIAGVEAFLLIVFAVTAENFFMQMLALPGSLGSAVKQWSKLLWFIVLLIAVFVFLHTLLNPRGDVAEALGETNVLFFLGTVVVFVCVSIAIWFWFRRAERRGRYAVEVPAEGLASPREGLPPHEGGRRS